MRKKAIIFLTYSILLCYNDFDIIPNSIYMSDFENFKHEEASPHEMAKAEV